MSPDELRAARARALGAVWLSDVRGKRPKMVDEKDWIVMLHDEKLVRVRCVSFDIRPSGALWMWNYGGEGVCAFGVGEWRSVRRADAMVEV